MSLYDRFVLPRLLDLAMRNRRLAPYRRRATASAVGRVLEIGVGSGLNLPLYGAAVAYLVAIDPSPDLLSLARRRGAAAARPPALARALAEGLPFDPGSFDTLITTWTLCSIADPAAALREFRRVLRPGGRLIFVEHGLAPDRSVARWQRLLTPLWRRIGGNCHLDRKIDDLLQAAGFQFEQLDRGYIPGPRPWTFTYEGRARA